MANVFQPPPTWAPLAIFTKQIVDGKAVDVPSVNPVWLKWFVDFVAVINASGGAGGTITHNSTAGLQGGTANQYYHVTAAQDALLAAITASAAQINTLASGLSVVITTAKLTGGGANGSMTFTNGVLTAQTAAT